MEGQLVAGNLSGISVNLSDIGRIRFQSSESTIVSSKACRSPPLLLSRSLHLLLPPCDAGCLQPNLQAEIASSLRNYWSGVSREQNFLMLMPIYLDRTTTMNPRRKIFTFEL